MLLNKGFSQNIIIKGKADKFYAGKIIQLKSLTDYITNTQQKEDQDTIQSDGFFELHFQSDFTQPVFLKIENVITKLYVQPDFVYGITIPELDKDFDYNNDAELSINIGVVGTDTTELNVLTYDYQKQLNNLFDKQDGKFLSRPMMFKRADTLKMICDKRYAKIKNQYFLNYVEYSIAAINASVSRGENYLINNYIVNKPIQYNHFEYMQFFNACFKGYLNSYASSQKGQSLYNIINVKADYNLLSDFLKNDKFLKSDSLRELVILKNLWDFYFSADFVPDAIETIISDFQQKTKIKQHKKIANSMLTYFNKMQAGSIAPDFSARTKDGTIGTLNSFKGRWIYINFFSTQNTESLREMPKIDALRKKFGDKVVFISICLDDSLKSYTNYLKTNPKFNWSIWYNYDKSFTKTAKDNYFVTGNEAYFFINNFGYLAQSPALAPSKGIEYKLNSIFKPAKRTTKTGIR
ncbi:MAG: redoxin domain-containing protein [Bacteroidota bacterium]|nr:redoxin domain-containing protein [Bacteroidota bacterium]